MRLLENIEENEYKIYCEQIENSSIEFALQRFGKLYNYPYKQVPSDNVVLRENASTELLKIPIIYALDRGMCDVNAMDEDTLNLLWNFFIDKNRRFDIFAWRKQQGLANVFLCMDYIDTQKELFDITSKECIDVIIDTVINSVLSVKMDEVQIWYKHLIELKKNKQIIINDVNNYECCCLEFPCSDCSLIYLENYGSSQDLLCNICHEMGHAMFNFYKHKNKIAVDREVDEFVAHYLEYKLCLANKFLSKKMWVNRIAKMINYEIVSTLYLHHLFNDEKRYSEKSQKRELFYSLCKKNKFAFDVCDFGKIMNNEDYLCNPFGYCDSIIAQEKILQALDLSLEFDSLEHLLRWGVTK